MAYLLILLGLAGRLLPHTANITPLGAVGLFGGARLPSKLAIAVPLAVLLLSDIIIGLYAWQVMVSVYLGFVGYGLAGLWVRKHYSTQHIILATLGASVVFFLITNAAVWAFTPLYPHTPNGLAASYLAAVPFFRNSLFGDLFYTGALFGIYELTQSAIGFNVKTHHGS